MLGAALFYSMMSTMAKAAGIRVPVGELVLVRSIIGVAISIPMLRAAKISIWGHRKSLLIFRGVAGCGALLCFFWSLTRLPLAEATVLFYMAPCFTAVLAAILLRERLHFRELLGFAASLVGVVFVAQPAFIFAQSSHALDLVAVGVGVLGAILVSFAYVAIRELRKTDDTLVIVFYFPFISIFICAPLVAANAVVPTATEWLLLIGVGVFTQIAQICFTRSLHLEKTSRAMSVSYVQIVFAVGLGFLAFAEMPDPLCFLGMAMVVGGTLTVISQGRTIAYTSSSSTNRAFSIINR